MLPIQAVLLFTAPPLFDRQTTCANLIACLDAAGFKTQPDASASGEDMRFRHNDLSINICLRPGKLERDEFEGATQSPLCRKSLETLEHAIDDHRHTILITLDRHSDGQQSNIVPHLQLSHCITTFFAKFTAPLAVHWRPSNILMTNNQYRKLAGQTTPWALFARLETLDIADTDATPGHTAITIQNADQFIGAPVYLHTDRISLDTACAAALAFLRHAATAEIPLGDGQTFGPEPGMLFRLTIVEPDPTSPTGQFHLWEANGQPETVPGDPARSPGATFKSSREIPMEPIRAADTLPPLMPAEADGKFDRLHGIALGSLMLVIMPPIGAALLVANFVFGSNGLRTGLIAMVTVAIAIVIGGYTFLSPGETSAGAVDLPLTIQVERLDN